MSYENVVHLRFGTKAACGRKTLFLADEVIFSLGHKSEPASFCKQCSEHLKTINRHSKQGRAAQRKA